MRLVTTIGDDDLDRMLSREEELLPSSGFTDSVMDTIWREAVTPRPIPFPWMRALPGLVAGAFALVTAVVTVVTLSGAAAQDLSASSTPAIEALWRTAAQARADLVGFALLLTLGSVAVSMHLSARRARPR